jgi:hypothetical protein
VTQRLRRFGRLRHADPVVPPDVEADLRRADEVVGRAGDEQAALGRDAQLGKREAIGRRIGFVKPGALGRDDFRARIDES